MGRVQDQALARMRTRRLGTKIIEIDGRIVDFRDVTTLLNQSSVILTMYGLVV